LFNGAREEQMVCPQDKELLAHGVRIDSFVGGLGGQGATLLTHAHADHLRNLTSKKCRIYCTTVTRDLAMIYRPLLDVSQFITVEYERPFHPAPGVTAWAIPSHHCDGSAMFLIKLKMAKGQEVRILYTGDFRFRPEMRSCRLLTDVVVDRLYYDDMFDEIDDIFPSYEDTVREMHRSIRDLMQRHTRIVFNVSILGIEPLLRSLAANYHYKYMLAPQLRQTWRGRQLSYLLPSSVLVDDSFLVLDHRKHDDGSMNWIIPSCTHFICRSKQYEPKPNHHYVWFAIHSNRHESTLLKAIVSASSENPCGDAISPNLQCSKEGVN